MIVLLLWQINFAKAEELSSIFNSEDFAGWKVPEDNLWWSVESGVIRGANDPDRRGSILWTEREFADFVLELEFKFGKGTVDSGVFLRDIREQIQIGISSSLKRDMTASPYIEGKAYPVEAHCVAENLRHDGWNAMRIVAKGKNYTVCLNGVFVMTYDSESAAEKGPIGLQVHVGHKMSIDFRNISLAELQ